MYMVEGGVVSKKAEFRIDFRLGYSRNEKFTGRTDILDKIHSHLKGNAGKARSRIVALYGPGGMGKTQIALEYAHKHHTDFNSAFLIDATNRDSARRSFVKVAERLVRHYAHLQPEGARDYNQIAITLGIIGLINERGHVSENDSTMDEVVEAMAEWFIKDQNRDWLLVFDNADDLETFNIKDFFPKQWGSILVTTRRPECSRFGVGIGLDEMSLDEGLLMLERISDSGPGTDPEGRFIRALMFTAVS